MKRPTDDLTQLADAAFRQAAEKILKRAEDTGIPLIICVNGKVQAVEPRAAREAMRRARKGRSGRRRRGQRKDG
jgi:hypothetical protein